MAFADYIGGFLGNTAKVLDPLGIGYGNKIRKGIKKSITGKSNSKTFFDDAGDAVGGFVTGAVQSVPIVGGLAKSVENTEDDTKAEKIGKGIGGVAGTAALAIGTGGASLGLGGLGGGAGGAAGAGASAASMAGKVAGAGGSGLGSSLGQLGGGSGISNALGEFQGAANFDAIADEKKRLAKLEQENLMNDPNRFGTAKHGGLVRKKPMYQDGGSVKYKIPAHPRRDIDFKGTDEEYMQDRQTKGRSYTTIPEREEELNYMNQKRIDSEIPTNTDRQPIIQPNKLKPVVKPQPRITHSVTNINTNKTTDTTKQQLEIKNFKDIQRHNEKTLKLNSLFKKHRGEDDRRSIMDVKNRDFISGNGYSVSDEHRDNPSFNRVYYRHFNNSPNDTRYSMPTSEDYDKFHEIMRTAKQERPKGSLETIWKHKGEAGDSLFNWMVKNPIKNIDLSGKFNVPDIDIPKMDDIKGYWNSMVKEPKEILKTNIPTKKKHGGVIPVDSEGLRRNKGPVIIPSNNITMQGINKNVIGVSDTGDTKLMKPNKNYKYQGNNVLEIPLAEQGMRNNPDTTTINIEKRELLVDENGTPQKRFDAPPHPSKGINPEGNREVPVGWYIIPNKDVDKYLGMHKKGMMKECMSYLKSLPKGGEPVKKKGGLIRKAQKGAKTKELVSIKEQAPVVIEGKYPQHLTLGESYERTNPRTKFLEKSSIAGPGSLNTNTPQMYEENKAKYIAEQILKTNPQLEGEDRGQWLERVGNASPKTKDIVMGNLPAEHQPTDWQKAKQATMPLRSSKSWNNDLTRGERGDVSGLDVLAPLSVPAKLVQSTYKKGYSAMDALKGKQNDSSMGEDILTDPTNLSLKGAGKVALGALGFMGRFKNYLKYGFKKGDSVNDLMSMHDDAVKALDSEYDSRLKILRDENAKHNKVNLYISNISDDNEMNLLPRRSPNSMFADESQANSLVLRRRQNLEKQNKQYQEAALALQIEKANLMRELREDAFRAKEMIKGNSLYQNKELPQNKSTVGIKRRNPQELEKNIHDIENLVEQEDEYNRLNKEDALYKNGGFKKGGVVKRNKQALRETYDDSRDVQTMPRGKYQVGGKTDSTYASKNVKPEETSTLSYMMPAEVKKQTGTVSQKSGSTTSSAPPRRPVRVKLQDGAKTIRSAYNDKMYNTEAGDELYTTPEGKTFNRDLQLGKENMREDAKSKLKRKEAASSKQVNSFRKKGVSAKHGAEVTTYKHGGEVKRKKNVSETMMIEYPPKAKNGTQASEPPKGLWDSFVGLFEPVSGKKSRSVWNKELNEFVYETPQGWKIEKRDNWNRRINEPEKDDTIPKPTDSQRQISSNITNTALRGLDNILNKINTQSTQSPTTTPGSQIHGNYLYYDDGRYIKFGGTYGNNEVEEGTYKNVDGKIVFSNQKYSALPKDNNAASTGTTAGATTGTNQGTNQGTGTGVGNRGGAGVGNQGTGTGVNTGGTTKPIPTTDKTTTDGAPKVSFNNIPYDNTEGNVEGFNQADDYKTPEYEAVTRALQLKTNNPNQTNYHASEISPDLVTKSVEELRAMEQQMREGTTDQSDLAKELYDQAMKIPRNTAIAGVDQPQSNLGGDDQKKGGFLGSTTGEKLVNASLLGRMGMGALSFIGSLSNKNNHGLKPQTTNPRLNTLANEAFVGRNRGMTPEESAKLTNQMNMQLGMAKQQARNASRSMGDLTSANSNIAAKGVDAELQKSIMNEKVKQQHRQESKQLEGELDRLQRANIGSENAIKQAEIQDKMRSAQQRQNALNTIATSAEQMGRGQIEKGKYEEMKNNYAHYAKQARNYDVDFWKKVTRDEQGNFLYPDPYTKQTIVGRDEYELLSKVPTTQPQYGTQRI